MRLAYDRRGLGGDYVRAACGLAVAAALLIFTPVSSVMFYVGVALTLLFVVFALRVAQRQTTVVTVDAEGIGATAFGGKLSARIGWNEMSDLSLRYYSTRRDRSGGWLELVVRAGRRRIMLDSALPGFDRLARLAADESARRGLILDPATVANLAGLGGMRERA